MDNNAIANNNMQYVDEMVEAIILRLIEEGSDDFWKVLKYGTKDALTNPAYTISNDDKYNMVIQGTDDTKILMQRYNDDISTTAHNELRIFESRWSVNSEGNYDLFIGFETIAHNTLTVLSNNKKPINIMRNEIYKLFNGRALKKSSGMVTNNYCDGVSMLFNNGYQGYYFTLRTFTT